MCVICFKREFKTLKNRLEASKVVIISIALRQKWCVTCLWFSNIFDYISDNILLSENSLLSLSSVVFKYIWMHSSGVELFTWLHRSLNGWNSWRLGHSLRPNNPHRDCVSLNVVLLAGYAAPILPTK